MGDAFASMADCLVVGSYSSGGGLATLGLVLALTWLALMTHTVTTALTARAFRNGIVRMKISRMVGIFWGSTMLNLGDQRLEESMTTNGLLSSPQHSMAAVWVMFSRVGALVLVLLGPEAYTAAGQ